MKRNVFSLFVVLISLTIFSQGKEDLLFIDIPNVIASSKRVQPITEAASNMEIISAEEIQMTGATNLGDVLRNVLGVYVRESDAAQHVIGLRGFCDTGHLLVTLDGNNVFMYHANHIFLDWAPVDIEEIDHIEIIKGPGSIFYGGNAFSGVINIITKDASEHKALEINAVYGENNTVRTNVMGGFQKNKLEFTYSAGYRAGDEWEEPRLEGIEGEEYNIMYFSAKAKYKISEKAALSAMARYSDAENVISTVCNPKTTFLSLRYDGNKDFWVRYFHNNHEKDFWNDTYYVGDSNNEIELFKSFQFKKNTLSIGSYAKNTRWEVETLKDVDSLIQKGNREEHSVQDFALNIENEFRISSKWLLNVGLRGEYYTDLDIIGSGRGSLIFNPNEKNNIRLVVASGYYLPSLFQQTNTGYAYPYAVGNSEIKQERITSFELNYNFFPNENLVFNSAVFYNLVNDLIDNTQTGPMQNVADGKQKGFELGTKYSLSKDVKVFANYSHLHSDRDDFGTLAVDPEHKFIVGFNANFRKFSLYSTFHWVDEYYEIYLSSNPVFGLVEGVEGADPVRVNSYSMLNMNLSYKILKSLSVNLSAHNLLNKKHFESNPPNEFVGNWHTGDKLGRRISVGLHYQL